MTDAINLTNVTSAFVWGATAAPDNLLSPDLVRPGTSEDPAFAITLSTPLAEYMTTGAGQFAFGNQFASRATYRTSSTPLKILAIGDHERPIDRRDLLELGAAGRRLKADRNIRSALPQPAITARTGASRSRHCGARRIADAAQSIVLAMDGPVSGW